VKTIDIARSALVWAGALPATAVFGTAAAVAGTLPHGQARAVGVARLWARSCLGLVGCRLRVRGLDNIAPGQHYVVMANHQSAADIPTLLAALPGPLKLTVWAKKSLFRIPFLGWGMRAMGLIPVDRTDRSTAAAMLADTLVRLGSGRSLLVFPEETYSRDGAMLPFQRGGFLVALKSGLPILPVGVAGTRAALPPASRLVYPRPVEVRVGRPIVTSDLPISERRQLTARTREEIAALAGQPLGE